MLGVFRGIVSVMVSKNNIKQVLQMLLSGNPVCPYQSYFWLHETRKKVLLTTLHLPRRSPARTEGRESHQSRKVQPNQENFLFHEKMNQNVKSQRKKEQRGRVKKTNSKAGLGRMSLQALFHPYLHSCITL